MSPAAGLIRPFDANRVDLESRLIKLLLQNRARLPATAAHGA